jgi:hypothetical protein
MSEGIADQEILHSFELNGKDPISINLKGI